VVRGFSISGPLSSKTRHLSAGAVFFFAYPLKRFFIPLTNSLQRSALFSVVFLKIVGSSIGFRSSAQLLFHRKSFFSRVFGFAPELKDLRDDPLFGGELPSDITIPPGEFPRRQPFLKVFLFFKGSFGFIFLPSFHKR